MAKLRCPVANMRCSRCGRAIEKNAPIVRAPVAGVAYMHERCEPAPASFPKMAPAALPAGWVTEDMLTTVTDVLQRPNGSACDDDDSSGFGADHTDDERAAARKDAGGDGDGSGGDAERDGERRGNVPDSRQGGSDDGGDAEEGEGDAEEGEGDADGDSSEASAPSSGPKLEDFPPDLLAKIVALAAGMAEGRVRAGLEPRLSGLMAELAEPIAAGMAAKFQSGMGDTVRDQLKREIDALGREANGLVESLRREIDKRVEDEVRRLDSARSVTVKIARPDSTLYEFPEGELFHAAFPEVLRLAGAGFDCFLPGPTGCGKTVLGEQIAKALGLPFAVVSGSGGTTESELLGNSTPDISRGENVYHTSEFVKVYEGGGLFLLDEADAMDPNALLKLNAAIANGFCPIPKRREKPVAKRHERFVFLMAANTWGTGATRLYCGRTRLDEATLDRFRAATVPMDYDPAIERRIVDDQPLYRQLAEWRAKIMANNLQRVLSTRFMAHAARLKRLGYTVADIGAKLTGGWTASETARVIGAK